MEASTRAVTLRLVEVVLPFHRPFATSTATVRSRRTILVGLSDGRHTGWGEAAPFPGVTPDDPASVWDALRDGARSIIEGRHVDALPLTAAAAVDEARWDLAARVAGVSLTEALGGSLGPIRASAAAGMAPTIDGVLSTVGAVVDEGFRSVKLKIKPGWDLEPVRAVLDTFPDLSIGLDANGAYADPHDPVLGLLDGLGATYLEQPLPAGDLGGHAFLRARLDTPICLDESVPSIRAAANVLEAEAADIICVKPGRLGIGPAKEVHDMAAESGIGVKATGLLESGIGRAHTVAVGCLPSVTDHDLAPTEWYFSADVASRPLMMEDGLILGPTGPGIGVDVDEGLLDALAVRESELV